MYETEEKNWAMLVHLATLLGFLIPFGSILGPVLIWLFKKDYSSYIDEQGKESINFQITFIIAFTALSLILLLITIILGIATEDVLYVFGSLLTFFLILYLFYLIAFVGQFILVIIAVLNCSQGKDYRYPVNFRILK